MGTSFTEQELAEHALLVQNISQADDEVFIDNVSKADDVLVSRYSQERLPSVSDIDEEQLLITCPGDNLTDDELDEETLLMTSEDEGSDDCKS